MTADAFTSGFLRTTFNTERGHAELDLLGWAICEPDLQKSRAVLRRVEPHHFLLPLHAEILLALNAILQDGRAPSVESIAARLAESTALAEYGGSAYLHGLWVPSRTADGVRLAARVREFSAQAEYSAEARSLSDDALRVGVPPSVTAQRGRDAAARFANALKRSAGNNEPASPYRFRLLSFDEVRTSTKSEWLVKGLIPRWGTTLIWGPPKCGKSFFTSDALLHVALGWQYRGHRTLQGPVVYCAFEGADGFRKRIEAFRRKSLTDHRGPVPFYLLPMRVDLINNHGEMIDNIGEQLEAKGESRAVAVVLDTLNRSLVGSESKDADMSAYIAAADTIREAFDCVVIIVHHCGVDDKRPRGHTALPGAADAQISVIRDALGRITARVEFMKDGPEDDVIESRLEVVPLGADEEGDEITSCIVVPVEDAEIPKPAKAIRLTDRLKCSLDALIGVIGRSGRSLPATFGLPQGIAAVQLDEWREEIFARGVLRREAANPREDFRRVKDALQAKQLIAVRNDLVWLVRPASPP